VFFYSLPSGAACPSQYHELEAQVDQLSEKVTNGLETTVSMPVIDEWDDLEQPPWVWHRILSGFAFGGASVVFGGATTVVATTTMAIAAGAACGLFVGAGALLIYGGWRIAKSKKTTDDQIIADFCDDVLVPSFPQVLLLCHAGDRSLHRCAQAQIDKTLAAWVEATGYVEDGPAVVAFDQRLQENATPMRDRLVARVDEVQSILRDRSSAVTDDACTCEIYCRLEEDARVYCRTAEKNHRDYIQQKDNFGLLPVVDSTEGALEQNRVHTYFLSAAVDDRAVVLDVMRQLQASGHTVHWSMLLWATKGHAYVDGEWEKKCQAADFVVNLLSVAYADGSQTCREFTFAKENREAGGILNLCLSALGNKPIQLTASGPFKDPVREHLDGLGHTVDFDPAVQSVGEVVADYWSRSDDGTVVVPAQKSWEFMVSHTQRCVTKQ
jgi:hypothetical protein